MMMKFRIKNRDLKNGLMSSMTKLELFERQQFRFKFYVVGNVHSYINLDHAKITFIL